MKARTFWLLALGFVAALFVALLAYSRRTRPTLTAVGPTLLSNQSSVPLSIYGKGLREGLVLQLDGPIHLSLPLWVEDDQHAFARFPSGVEIPADQVQVDLFASLSTGDGRSKVTVVNDRSFPDFTALARFKNGTAAVSSMPTDELYLIHPSGRSSKFTIEDGPASLAVDGDRLWVGYRYSPWLDGFDSSGQRTAHWPAPAHASALAVCRDIAYLAETVGDSVSAIDLNTGRVLWKTRVAPNPGVLTLAGRSLAVGSHQTGEVELLDLANGHAEASISPSSSTSIVGGPTEKYAPYAMGGKAVRALLYVPSANVLLLSSIGPNIGPNPDRMEVSMNGGIGVIDLSTRRFVRHLGFGAGVTEGLATEEGHQRLYAADLGLGLVRVLDLQKLIASERSAGEALIAEWPMQVPKGFPLIRPPSDFGGAHAGLELHAGPSALALGENELVVLNRHAGTIQRMGLSSAPVVHAKGLVPGSPAAVSILSSSQAQPTRRSGEVLYFADLGRTGMSCDACHLEGHTEGIFFAKTRPLRIYRSPTLRGARETPPYFVPASTRSLAETAAYVGSRNRYHHPDLSVSEVQSLTTYTAALSLLPNPYRDSRGVPFEGIDLPNGHRGHPRQGRALFEASCQSCHPPPLFTTDQSPETRGRQLDVGTPHALPLRETQQDLTFLGFPPPSLLGIWDVFPQLTSGAAGLEVKGDQVVVRNRCATCDVLEHFSGPQHGNAQVLTSQERDDLLAFLLTL